MTTPSPHNDENWSAAGMVGLFDAEHRRRDRVRYRWCVLLGCLTVAIVLGVPLTMTWLKYQDARRQTLLEEYASRRVTTQTLNQANPAVEAALNEADQLRDSARTGGMAQSGADLRQALQKLAHADDIDRDERRIRKLLDPVGQTLLKTPWLHSSAVIDAQIRTLNQQHAKITELLDLGDLDAAENALGQLLSDVGQLQRGNVEAMQTSLSRQAWVRLKTAVPERLKDNSGWQTIQDVGKDAERGWDAGDWNDARTLYARATERTQTFLDAELKPDEKAELLKSDTDAIARLETEKADLQQQLKSLQTQLTGLASQFATTNVQHQQALTQLKERTTQRDQFQTTAKATAAELVTLQGTKSALGTTIDNLAKAKKRADTLATEMAAANESVERFRLQLAAKTAEVDVLRKSAASGSASGAVVQVSASLAAIDSRMAVINSGSGLTSKATSTRTHLADALQEYDKAVQLRQQAIAAKYRPGSTKVQGIDATITQAVHTLKSGLKQLDEPLEDRFDQLQTVITTAEADYQTLLKEVLPEHRDARTLKQKIDGLKAQQKKLSAAHARHDGTTSPDADELVTLCRRQVSELLAERQAAEFEKMRREGKVPTAAGMPMLPIAPGTFTMGSDEVTISKPFFAGKYEVTIEQILTWLNSSGVTFQDKWIDLSASDCPIKKSGRGYVRNTSTDFASSAKQPMQNISWYGAKAFCSWCSDQDSRFTYRLPTEAEWEYMARAGSTTAYPWGDSCNGTNANVDGNHPHGTSTKGPYLQKTTAVGSYAANAWGLCDTVGNVWEWCEDTYNGSVSSRVLRGGSWYRYAIYARSSARLNSPGRRGRSIGFRVVAE